MSNGTSLHFILHYAIKLEAVYESVYYLVIASGVLFWPPDFVTL